MTDDDLLTIRPVKARVDASTLCQLRCPLCPTAENDGRTFLGRGNLALADFVRFLEENPGVRDVELASAGEALLNPRLPEILQAAAERGVTTSLTGGVNMNDASDEVLDALVRWGVRRIRVSVDGMTEETYREYRVGGSLRRVLRNLRKLNEAKRRHGSDLPEVVLQFILFGHNEHELDQARLVARMLNAKLFVKLNRDLERFGVRNRDRIRELLGYADRREYREATGTLYCRELCLLLWRSPQVNWDGRLLGCACNKTGAFAESVLDGRYAVEVNNERMRYARKMLMGAAPPREDIPCTTCSWYGQMKEHGLWITPDEVRSAVSFDAASESDGAG